MIASQLEGSLDGFRAGVAQKHLLGVAPRSQFAQTLGQLEIDGIVEVGSTDVDEAGGLGLNGLDDSGMAMPGGTHGDASSAVQKAVAIDVFDHDPVGAPYGEGIYMR
jgi:hypothetical protein